MGVGGSGQEAKVSISFSQGSLQSKHVVIQDSQGLWLSKAFLEGRMSYSRGVVTDHKHVTSSPFSSPKWPVFMDQCRPVAQGLGTPAVAYLLSQKASGYLMPVPFMYHLMMHGLMLLFHFAYPIILFPRWPEDSWIAGILLCWHLV